MNFKPVSTVLDLETLDHSEIVEGYLSAEKDDPEPGPNRGRAYWHGWCNRMRDKGAMAMEDASWRLARELVTRGKGVEGASQTNDN